VYRLSSSDYEKILDLGVAILDGGTHSPWFLLADGLNDALHATITLFHSDVCPGSRTAKLLAWAPATLADLPLQARSQEYAPQHPLASHYAAGHGTTPLTISDILDEPTWRRSPNYAISRRDWDGATRHLVLPLRTAAGTVRALLVARPGKDYDERDREFARRLQPLLIGIDRHLTELQRLNDTIQPPTGCPTPEQRAIEIGLTPRELTVLALLAEGLTAAAASRRLGISTHTVTKHLENTYRKCDTHDRLTTVMLARQLGLLPETNTATATRHTSMVHPAERNGPNSN
jgi:DNA-binding CsgD family transcriptional regulator